MTIPQELREALSLALSAAEVSEPGDYVALRPLIGGILISMTDEKKQRVFLDAKDRMQEHLY